MDNKLLYEKEKATKNYLTDSFYLNTQKPVPLSQKIKGKFKKYAKPFGLGISAYLGFELVKNIFVKTSDLVSAAYAYTSNLFGTWFDSINISLLNASTTPEHYHCSGISGVLGHGCARYGVNSITDIINIVSYTMAVAFILKSFIKFKEYNETKGETPISQPIVYAVVAALLFALPTFISVSASTVWSGYPQGSFNVGTNL